MGVMASFFLFGLNGEIWDDQRLNLLTVDGHLKRIVASIYEG